MIDIEAIFKAGYMASSHKELVFIDGALGRKKYDRELSRYRINLTPEPSFMYWLHDDERAIASIIADETERYREKVISESPERKTPEGYLPFVVHPFELVNWGMLLINHVVLVSVINRVYKEHRANGETKGDIELRVLRIVTKSLEPQNKGTFESLIDERLGLVCYKSSNWERPKIGKEFQEREGKATLLVIACIDEYQRSNGNAPATAEQLIDFATTHPVQGYGAIAIEEGAGNATSLRKIKYDGGSVYWKHVVAAFGKQQKPIKTH